jgi:hypothetical protein
MKWLSVDKYHMKSGSYIIATYFSHDKVKFGLSHNNTFLGFFDSEDEAKAKADSHAS